MKYKYYIIAALIVCAVVFCFAVLNRNEIAAQIFIMKGVDFLDNNQLDYGEFVSERCDSREMRSCVTISSPYISTFVLETLSGLEGRKVERMKTKGLEFLKQEQKDGLWGYWASRSGYVLDPDVDDTAAASHILRKNGINIQENREIVKGNIDEKGRFFTWFKDRGEWNDVDCAVNANVLRYLQQQPREVCDYVNAAVKIEGSCSIYSMDPLLSYYMVSRAYADGISCLGENKKYLIDRILKLSRQDGTFGDDLQTSLALGSLMNLGYYGSEVQGGVIALTKRQDSDGSWKKEDFYSEGGFDIHYGSKELTTALAIDALNRYYGWQNDIVSKAVERICEIFR